MSRTVYIDGDYLPEEEARVSIFDRGFLFADAVYEVVPVLEGKLLDLDGHMTRLKRSLDELEIPSPMPSDSFVEMLRKLARLNTLEEGMVYMQVTRGSGDRDFLIRDTRPLVVAFTQVKNLLDSTSAKHGVKVITLDDLRWRRRDIKTVQLLYPSLAKSRAVKAGADDAWLIEDGYITEGTSNNAFIVDASGTIRTRNLSTDILHGITRASVLECAAEMGLDVDESRFTLGEALDAREAFITAASLSVTSVVEINGQPVGDGKPGPVARRLREIYIKKSLDSA